jgi:hypothetical protein
MTRPPVRDSIVPGSARPVVIHEEYVLVTVECGRCGNRQEARATSKTTRCKECDRACRVAAPDGDPNVTPLRRTA